MQTNSRQALAQKVGLAAAVGAALAACSSSDTSPTPQTQNDAAAGTDSPGAGGGGGVGGGGSAGLDGGGGDALEEVFQSDSPEDIAAELEAMVDSEPEGSAGTGGAPVYKGVILD